MLLALLAVLAAAPAPGPRPYTAMDQVMLRRLVAFTVSPDGATVVLVVRATDYEANKGKLDLWAVKADGSGLPAAHRSAPPPGNAAPRFLRVRGSSMPVLRAMRSSHGRDSSGSRRVASFASARVKASWT